MLAVDIRDLCKTYANGVVALKNVNFQVRPGEFVGLLGPNGAGKSTIISIINTLTIKSSGHVSVFEKNLDTHSSALKQRIGTVPQEFNFSIFERVDQIVQNQAGYFGLTRKLARQRTEKYLRLLELWEKRHSTARSLSGGMKRRLMIARAMVHEPDILILDEPTAGVDIDIRRSMWDFLIKLNEQGTTILLTSHYLEEVEYLCDRVAIIDKGVIIKDANKKLLLSELDSETFVFDTAQALPVDVSHHDFSLFRVDERTLEASFSKKQDLNSLFEFFSSKGITIKSMRNKANRLEELFLNVTSKGGSNNEA